MRGTVLSNSITTVKSKRPEKNLWKLSSTLRQVRVSVELRNDEGKTALYICAELGNPMTVKLLMQSGNIVFGAS